MKFRLVLWLCFGIFLNYSFLVSNQILDEDQYLFRGSDLTLDTPVKADISFCIADLKFDGQNLKVCEFGEGCHSKFRGFNRLYGQGKVWELFWIYLSQFKLPIWYVGVSRSQKFCEEVSYETFVRSGGDFIGSFNLLEKDKKFLSAIGKGCVGDLSCLSNYKAIVYVKTFNESVRSFMEKYPNVLVLDIATAYYVNSKYRTTLLFNDDELLKYRPKFWILKREGVGIYSDISCLDNIIDPIISEFDYDYYVIKPVSGSMGKGISIVSKKDLKNVLRSILTIKSGKFKRVKQKDKNLSFWSKNKNKYCLVEEFVRSKTIEIEGKRYDPTMRVFFVLCFDRGIPLIKVLGAYWKMPPIALNEKGDFVDKHKSHIIKQKHSSWPVDQKDLEKVTEIMQQFMPRIYANMIFKTRMPVDLD